MQAIRDLIVLIPGIMGSVLQHNGRDLWAQTPAAVWRGLFESGEIDKLILKHDDPERDDLGDGLTAPALMPGIFGMHGLDIGAGYSPVDAVIHDYFDLQPGIPHHYHSGRYVHFPYDWRRDNRYTARRLKRFVDQHLAELRRVDPDAKVILLAHSMGGLVATYYLDVLEGENWNNCRALITFGTPFRGSVNAIGALSNGAKKLWLDVTPVVRSFTSVYQLLPRYPVIRIGDTYQRVAEMPNLPGIDQQRARDALHFQQEIEPDSSIQASLPYLLLPVVGCDQPTLQSASFDGQTIVTSYDPPTALPQLYAHGDGTVPRVSATPLRLSEKRSETFYSQRHATLQNHVPAWMMLTRHIQELQDDILRHIRGPELVAEAQPACSLQIESLYKASETIHPMVTMTNAQPTHVRVTIRADGTDRPLHAVQFDQHGQAWEGDLPLLAPGVYHIEVRADGGSPPLQEIIEVI